MKFQNLSVKRLFGRVAMGLVLSMSGITIALFFVTKQIAVLLTGGALLGAIFMATDYVTSPMTNRGMLLYGIGIGAITVLIRIWGQYPEGMSFAILIMNAFVPLIDKYVKPRRFGAVRKARA